MRFFHDCAYINGTFCPQVHYRHQGRFFYILELERSSKTERIKIRSKSEPFRNVHYFAANALVFPPFSFRMYIYCDYIGFWS